MGKKSAPKAPPPPDPVATANAQGAQNREAAITQANLNRIDQVGPTGSLTYEQIGTNADGSPRYRQTESLNPAEQAKYDLQNKVALSLSGLANDSISRVSNTTGSDFNFNNINPVQSNASGGLPSLRTNNINPNAVQGIFGQAGPLTYVATGGDIRGAIDGAGSVTRAVTNAGDITNSIEGGGAITRDIDSAGSVGRIDPSASNGIQRNLNYSGLGDINGAGDFAKAAGEVGDATYAQATSRLDPAFQQQRSDLEARLVNSGIPAGSEAFNREIGNFDRSRNDAYNQANFSAIQARGQEQNRLFGIDLAARQQGQNEINAQGDFNNNAQAQSYSQIANSLAQNNSAQAQQFNQNAQQATFGNNAQAQQFSQNSNQAEFANNAQRQRFDQGVTNANINNSAQGQIFGQNAQQAGFANDAQNQRFNQGATNANINNSAQSQQFDFNRQAAEFGNNAEAQRFNQNLARDTFNNQARSQQFSENLAGANLNNTAREQQTQEASYLRNLPIQDIAALLGAGPGVANPEFSNVAQVGVAAPDYQGAVYQNYNALNQQYQQKLQSRASGLGSIFGTIGSLGSAAIASDIRLKTNIVPLGGVNGIPTYMFDYIGGETGRIGVMAHEIEAIDPFAVMISNSGLKTVVYEGLYGNA